MEMTKHDIIQSYKTAANKRNQIKVLADLNRCEKSDIEKIIKDEGLEIPEASKRGRKPSAPSEPVKKIKPKRTPKSEEKPITTQCEAIEPVEEEIEEIAEVTYPDEEPSEVPVEVRNLVVARIDEITTDLAKLENALIGLQEEYKTLMRFLKGDVL